MSDDTKNKPAAPGISDAAMAAAVKFVSEQMIPAAVAAAVAATTKQGGAGPLPAAPKSKEKCTDCGQTKSTGCMGQHVEMVVFPKSYSEYFTGVTLNGVKYLSNHENHKITVPASCESMLQGIVDQYEKNERELATGRKASRHSGQVSPHGSSVNPANQAWR